MRISTIAFANLRRRKGKALFLASGISIGIGTAVALLSLSGSLREEIGSQLDRFGANIVVTPHSDSLALDYGGISVSGVSFDQHQLSNEDAAGILRIPYRKRLSVVAPKLLGTVEVAGRKTLIAGVDFASELRLKKWWRLNGRAPESATEVLLGYDIARAVSAIEALPGTSGAADQGTAHHSAAPDVFRVTRERVTVGGREHRIAGVIGQTGGPEDRMVFAQLGQVQDLLGRPGQLSVIEVSALCKDCPVEDMVAQIRKELPHANVSAIQQSVRARTEAVDRLTQFSMVVSVVVLAIGALMIFTTMMSAVVERTKEIGVLRAIGFRRTHIIKGLMIEVVIISAVGGVAGWFGGLVASRLALPYFTEAGAQIELRVSLAAFAIAVAMLTGIISSIYPVMRASRLDPSEAVRYV
ncbi:MAG: ABC transporter permease [Bryobacterales bacterium]|nr:ABC transporter permease [Bryobacterales bacterium]